MKNEKGFTIIELGVSISLVTVVALLLFQMLTTVKRLYTTSDLKTTLLTKQGVITDKIYNDLDGKTLYSITNCDVWQNSCIKFNFVDGTSSQLMVDPLRNILAYNNYVINYDEIDDTILFGELEYSKKDSFFTIKVPVESKSVSGNFGIKITNQHFNSVENSFSNSFTTINIPLSKTVATTIINDGSNYWMRVYDASNTNMNSILDDYVKRLKTTPCSANSFTGKSYELKTGTNTSRWCQDTNFYTQNVKNYGWISGLNFGSLGKDTYAAALKSGSNLKSTTLDLKVNSFVDKYTFKER